MLYLEKFILFHLNFMQVICCEGNSGFYEYGITLTPIEAGYSVLGWNHPGFGSSTVSIKNVP